MIFGHFTSKLASSFRRGLSRKNSSLKNASINSIAASRSGARMCLSRRRTKQRCAVHGAITPRFSRNIKIPQFLQKHGLDVESSRDGWFWHCNRAGPLRTLKFLTRRCDRDAAIRIFASVTPDQGRYSYLSAVCAWATSDQMDRRDAGVRAPCDWTVVATYGQLFLRAARRSPSMGCCAPQMNGLAGF